MVVHFLTAVLHSHKTYSKSSITSGMPLKICSMFQAIDVLNGIAWDEENNRLFVTGKLWPKLYEIKLRPVDGPPDGSVERLCPRASFY
uniref:Glutaminyl-peptide cyclotransferase n=1 Tax=Triticum urartu TaxID=4572 RepID=A0A8R7UWW0_TRIUA